MNFDDSISLKEVLKYMDTGHPFSICFVTCDTKKGTGGEWIEIKNCRKHMHLSAEKLRRLEKAQPVSGYKKDPKHYENSTRNLKLPNGEIRKVHIRLIRKFNNKTVL